MKKFLAFFPGLLVGVLSTALFAGAALLLAGSFYVHNALQVPMAKADTENVSPLIQPGELFLTDQTLVSAVNDLLSAGNMGVRLVSLKTAAGTTQAVIALKAGQFIQNDFKIPFLGVLTTSNNNEFYVRARFAPSFNGKDMVFRFSEIGIGNSPIPLDLLLSWCEANKSSLIPAQANDSESGFSIDFRAGIAIQKDISGLSAWPRQFSLEDIRTVSNGFLVRYSMDKNLPKKLEGSLLVFSGTLPDIIATAQAKLSNNTALLSSLKELEAVVTSSKSVITQPAFIQFSEPGTKLIRAGKELAADIGVTVADGDRISTGKGSAEIAFPDGTIIKIAPNSATVINMDFRGERSVDVTIDWGSLRALVSKISGRDEMIIRSSTSVCAVRGTDFAVTMDKKGDFTLEVLSGAVEIKALDGSGTEIASFREKVVILKERSPQKSIMTDKEVTALDLMYPLHPVADTRSEVNTPETIQYKYLQALLNMLTAYNSMTQEEKDIFEKDFPVERLAPLVRELVPEMTDFGIEETEEDKI